MTFVIALIDQNKGVTSRVLIERKQGVSGEVLPTFVFPAWDILSEYRGVEKP